jgi:hypothetical protein
MRDAADTTPGSLLLVVVVATPSPLVVAVGAPVPETPSPVVVGANEPAVGHCEQPAATHAATIDALTLHCGLTTVMHAAILTKQRHCCAALMLAEPHSTPRHVEIDCDSVIVSASVAATPSHTNGEIKPGVAGVGEPLLFVSLEPGRGVDVGGGTKPSHGNGAGIGRGRGALA